MSLIFTTLLFTISYIQTEFEIKPKPVKNVTDYSRPIKLAFAIFDAPYEDSDYDWLAERAGLVIVHEYDEENMLDLKELNPDIKIFLYKFSGMTNETLIGHSASGFTEISKNHQDWFLRTTSGKKVYDDYNAYSRTHSFYMDYGKSDWTRYAYTDYKKSLQGPWDGLFLDVIYFDTDQYMPQVVDYDRIEYEKAVQAHLIKLNNELEKEGKELILNGATIINHEPIDQWAGRRIDNLWSELYKITDGVVEEAFVNFYHWKASLVWQSEERWERQIQALEESGKQGKIFVALAHNRGLNRQDAIYNAASYLLGAHENSYFLNQGIKGYRLGNYQKDYETFQAIYNVPLGDPIDKRYSENGLWKRKFENGLVIVDNKDKQGLIILNSGDVIQ